MKIVSLDRGQGKTTQLVDWFMENPEGRVLFVADGNMRDHVTRLLQYRLGKLFNQAHIERRVLTYAMVRGGALNGLRPEAIAIDELEHFLASIFRQEIDVVTMGPLPISSTITWEEDE